VVGVEQVAGAALAHGEDHPATANSYNNLAANPDVTIEVGSEAFEAVCTVLEERLGAQRAILPGAGHSVQRLGEPDPHRCVGLGPVVVAPHVGRIRVEVLREESRPRGAVSLHRREVKQQRESGGALH